MRLTSPHLRFIVPLVSLLVLMFATAASAAPTPTNLAASNVTATSATLSWSAPSTGAQYGLYRNSRYVANTKAFSYTFTGLTCSTTYRLGVRTFNGGGDASPIAELPVQTAACGGSSPPPAPTAPANTSLPAISGLTQSGSTLTASVGSWTGTLPMSYSFSWSRCDTGGGACVTVTGANGQSFVLGAADVGKTLRVIVGATNSAGSASATSAATAQVTSTSSPPPGGGGGGGGGGGASGSVVLVDQPWVCTGPVNMELVKVTMRTANKDAISLGSGCTGRIGRIEVETWTQDGVKVQNNSTNAAHDLVIESGTVKCWALSAGAHQDAMQAMGGARITFQNVVFDCVGHSNFFVGKGGSGATTPTDIVCDNCRLGPNGGNAARIAGESSVRSGVRNTIACRSFRWNQGLVFSGSGYVNSANVETGPSDARCVTM
jgi:hypothetical protein